MTRFLALMGVILLTVSGVAAPPEVTYLFPSGGQSGTEIDVRLGGKVEPWPPNIWCNDPILRIEPSKQKGQLRVTIPEDSLPGVRWLRVHGSEGASARRAFVVGQLREVIEKEPNDTPAKAQLLTPESCVVNGQLAASNDVDCFALPMKQGQTLVASLLANRILGSPMDAILQIVSPEGFVLTESNDDFGLDPQTVLKAPSDGTYVVRVFAFPETPNSSIRFANGDDYVYRLSLAIDDWVDHPFPLAVQAGQNGRVRLHGWNLDEGAETDHNTEWIRFPGLETRKAIFRIEPHECVTESETDRITVPMTVSGHIRQPGEMDRFRFTANQKERVLLKIEARSSGSQLNPLLRVRDADGKILKEVDDVAQQPDPEILFVVPADGEYVAEVRDLFGHGSWRHWYRLRVTTPVPDFSLTTDSDRFTGEAGKPIEIAVNVNRQYDFKDSIELTVDGLPDTAEVLEKAVSADAKARKVTLKVRGSEAFSGPIRVLGTGGEITRSVEQDVEHVWLTIRITE